MRDFYDPARARARLAGEVRRVPMERRVAMQFREWEEHPWIGVVLPRVRPSYPTVPVERDELPPFVLAIARRRLSVAG